jgi:hypothetical protein
MEGAAQQFIVAVKRIQGELRRIVGKLAQLHEDIEKHITTITNADRREQRQESPDRIPVNVNSHEDVKRDQKANENRQYRVQNSLKRATWCAFIAASVYAAIAGFQSCEMRQATEATKEAADAAKQNASTAAAQTELANKSLQATIDNFHLEQRAWVGPLVINAEMVIGKPLIVAAKFKNTGRTPAINVIPAGFLQPVTEGYAPDFTMKTTGPQTRTVMPPDGTIILERNGTRGGVMTPAIFDALESGKLKIYIFGKIAYEDVFNCGHWTQYCFVFKPDTKSFLECNTHNAVDNEYCR